MRLTDVFLSGGGLRELRDDAVIIVCGTHEINKRDDE